MRLNDYRRRLWIDSFEPDRVASAARLGAVGCTSNPSLVSKQICCGGLDSVIAAESRGVSDPNEILGRVIQHQLIALEHSAGLMAAGIVAAQVPPNIERAGTREEQWQAYVEAGRYLCQGSERRMAKVPATEVGISAGEELLATGTHVMFTLIMSLAQYRMALSAAWRAHNINESARSAYAVFVGRIDRGFGCTAADSVGAVVANTIQQENALRWGADAARHPVLLASVSELMYLDVVSEQVEATLSTESWHGEVASGRRRELRIARDTSPSDLNLVESRAPNLQQEGMGALVVHQQRAIEYIERLAD